MKFKTSALPSSPNVTFTESEETYLKAASDVMFLSTLGDVLLEAAKKGDIQKVKVALESEPLLIRARSKATHNSLFHLAAQGGHLEILSVLARGNSVVSLDRLLKDKDAGLFSVNKEGKTPDQVARELGHTRIVEFYDNLRENVRIPDRKEFLNAVNRGLLMQPFYLISLHSDAPNPILFARSSSNGNSALHYAAQKGHTELFCKLMRYFEIYKLGKEEFSRPNYSNDTPLDLARKQGQDSFLTDPRIEAFMSKFTSVEENDSFILPGNLQGS